MTGKPDGLRMLDLSAEGFWDSFFAIVVAAPALFVSWVAVANEIGGDGPVGGRIGILLALALTDVVSWIAPLALLGLAARTIGIGDRFVHYVVATNWASVILVWIMVPPAVVRLFLPGLTEISILLSLGLFGLTLVLLWRVTNAALGKGAGIATGVFAGMFTLSLVILLGMQKLLGLGQL